MTQRTSRSPKQGKKFGDKKIEIQCASFLKDMPKGLKSCKGEKHDVQNLIFTLVHLNPQKRNMNMLLLPTN